MLVINILVRISLWSKFDRWIAFHFEILFFIKRKQSKGRPSWSLKTRFLYSFNESLQLFKSFKKIAEKSQFIFGAHLDFRLKMTHRVENVIRKLWLFDIWLTKTFELTKQERCDRCLRKSLWFWCFLVNWRRSSLVVEWHILRWFFLSWHRKFA